ncbi:MAG: bifunctional 2-polyprenyl-6-hydroxyphenol methylase/3-demethylubiquinol 3-O-methyltransferase UbiG [Gammaproteobacteria bacterium]
MNIINRNSETENVNPDEIALFDKLAEHWWDPMGECKPLHDINPLRANWIQQHDNIVEKQGLDLGCGGGILSEALAQRGAVMTGIDMSEKAIHAAQQHLSTSKLNIAYHHTTAETWADKHPEQYDFITCLEMLEHVPDPASTVAACFRLVKPGGSVFFSTINRNPKAFALAIVAAEHILKLLPKGTHHYAQFIRPSELARWVRQAGGIPQDLIGLTYNPITKTYSLQKDVSVNYLMASTKAQ